MRCCGGSIKASKLVASLLLIAAVAGGVWFWYERLATYHFAEVRPGVLYRDGNRGTREFATACRKSGAKTVVMLVSEDEASRQPFAAEAEFCRSRGIRLVHIPVGLGKRPKTEDVRKFLEVAEDPKHQPVLVHCAQGVRRTAMMTAAYQETILGYDNDKAKQAILPWGRKPEKLNDIRSFIDDYDPATRTVGNGHLLEMPTDAD
jgi:protein tyrosine/serine phosphatase